jgi:hypothetical protein
MLFAWLLKAAIVGVEPHAAATRAAAATVTTARLVNLTIRRRVDARSGVFCMALLYRVHPMPRCVRVRAGDTLSFVITRLGSRFWSDAIRCLALGTLSVVLVAGCTSSAMVDPSSTSTTGAFTHTQVLSWVTPTLGNGISFVGSLSSGSTTEQMTAASRPLGAAAPVSLHELAQVSWNGALQPSEKELVNALLRIEKLTAVPPGPGYLDQLDDDILSVKGALRALNYAVKG